MFVFRLTSELDTEFFKELDSIQPINIIPKEHFYSVFGNVVKDFYNNQEDENN